WAVDTSSNAACVDGTSVPNAVSDHYMWDANTLAGTVEVTINVPSCGQPAGHKFTVNVQLRQAPLTHTAGFRVRARTVRFPIADRPPRPREAIGNRIALVRV